MRASCSVEILFRYAAISCRLFNLSLYVPFWSRCASALSSQCLPIQGHSGTGGETGSMVVPLVGKMAPSMVVQWEVQLVGTTAPETVVQKVVQLVVQWAPLNRVDACSIPACYT